MFKTDNGECLCQTHKTHKLSPSSMLVVAFSQFSLCLFLSVILNTKINTKTNQKFRFLLVLNPLMKSANYAFGIRYNQFAKFGDRIRKIPMRVFQPLGVEYDQFLLKFLPRTFKELNIAEH